MTQVSHPETFYEQRIKTNFTNCTNENKFYESHALGSAACYRRDARICYAQAIAACGENL